MAPDPRGGGLGLALTAASLRQLVARALRPPLRDPRFWLVQAMVIVIAAAYWAAVVSASGGFLFLWAGELQVLLLVPVVYAALNFGLAGSLATAVWVSVLTLASLPLRDAAGAWTTALEALVFLGAGAIVGDRVERETKLRHEAEEARGALRASEARLRSLFENSPAATLIVGAGGTVREANPAAAGLFGRPRPALIGASLASLVGAEPAASIAAGAGAALEIAAPGGGRRFLRPVVSVERKPAGDSLQVVFLDVSEERRRLGVKDAYAAHVIKAQEEERARIAQELHDEPLQTLVHLYRLLDRLAGEGADRAAVRDGLAEARSLAEGIAEELGRLARGLRPASLEDLGLVAALQRLARDTEGRTGLRATLAVSGEPRRLDPLAELGLFRIAQEGLRNSERHAHGSRIDVGLDFGPEAVTLTVEDDGRGLPAGTAREGDLSGLGLVGMQERAALLGGRFELESAPGRGTRLRAAIPTR